jgi:hypothetical protein
MALAIPGAQYLFSILQHVLVDQPNSTRLRLKLLVLQSLSDWRLLAKDLARCLTPIQSLVPNPPSFLGAVDASGEGLGGFWLPTPHGNKNIRPILFRLAFPASIKSRLVTHENPAGDITNSDLELAALVVGSALLRHHAPGAHASLLCASDNTAAVS